MLLPACVALFLQMLVSRDSPIRFRLYRESPRWVFHSFLLLTFVYGVFTVVALAARIRVDVAQALAGALMTGWTLLVIFLYRRSGEAKFRAAGLQLGKVDTGMRFALATVAFLLLQATLNFVAGTGRTIGGRSHIENMPIPEGAYPLAVVMMFFLSITGRPLAGLAVAFGEEYAWRGFLQSEFMKLGKRLGAALIGVVWAAWHIPVIAAGIHTYRPTLAGFGLALIFFVLWGYVLSYSVLKTGSIWVPAYLHGLVNSLHQFILDYLVRPIDRVWSFGLGVYGLACLGVVVVAILRDPLWKNGAQRISAQAASA